ncbi:MAG: acyl-CoA dehydrogenase family protein, partial [Geminicoccales bacterium]
MDFALSEEQQMVVDTVRDFVERELYPLEDEVERTGEVPDEIGHAIRRKVRKMGFYAANIPEKFGGGGLDHLTFTLLERELGRASMALTVHFGRPSNILCACDAEQRERYLLPAVRGEKIDCLAMTEPEAGSAVTDLRTSAAPDGDGFRINGTKVYTTHGRHADVLLAYVRYGPGLEGIGSVLIERGMKGFTTGKPVRFLSGEEWVQLFFDDVLVGPENVVLGEGGFRKQIAGFNVERIGNAARALALGQHAFGLARDYAATREQFGRPLCEFQGLQWKFADMKMALDAARLLLYRAACNA